MLRSELDSVLATGSARGAGAGFAIAAQPVAAHAITTDTAGLVAGAVTIAAGDFALPAYHARPAGEGPFPIVLVVSEIFGVHEHIADVARRFAKLGYLAVRARTLRSPGRCQGDRRRQHAVRDDHLQGAGRSGDGRPRRERRVGEGARRRYRCGSASPAFAGAAASPGSTPRTTAALKAGVAWYGRLLGPTTPLQPAHPVDVAARLQAPVLGLYGGADAGIPLESVERMKAALADGSAGARRSQLVVYPQAQHAFHADYRPNYDEAAARDGWRALPRLAARAWRRVSRRRARRA